MVTCLPQTCTLVAAVRSVTTHYFKRIFTKLLVNCMRVYAANKIMLKRNEEYVEVHLGTGYVKIFQ